MKILLAVDGSKQSLKATERLIADAKHHRAKPEVELVTVHLPVPAVGGMGRVISRNQLARYYEEEGAASLAGASRKLKAARIVFRTQVLVGPVAESIVKHAAKARCERIYIGSHGRSAISYLFLGSVASKVLQLSKVPVLLVR